LDYSLISCDLRELSLLQSKLVSIGFDVSLPTLILTECVMTYMNVEDSDKIINWAASSFPRSIFVCYEQIVPYV
jgi:O-methyltransferase involved in polyketide biosynthesis